MASGNDTEFGFEQRTESFLSSQSSGTYSYASASSLPLCDVRTNPCSSSIGMEAFFGGRWDPLLPVVSQHQSGSFSYNNRRGLGDQVIEDNSHLLEHGRLPSLGSEGFPDIVGSFALPECTQIAASVSPPGFPEQKDCSIEKTPVTSRSGIMGGANYGATNQEDSPVSDSSKKRKRDPDHCSDSMQNGDGKLRNGSNATNETVKEKDDKKQKLEESALSGSRKVGVKPSKDSSQTGVAQKEDYIHVRARRGQATNSHSLAERVRREKISERMRFLQDLVPGCNKITGKAVMLDEIINYVQSLQRQVEFLSMKLATVNPELNFDLERILSKDIVTSQVGGPAILKFGPGIAASPPPLLVPEQGSLQDEMVVGNIDNSGEVLKAMNSRFSTTPQIPMPTIWNDELRALIHQMGFISNAPPDNHGPQGGTRK